MKLKLALLILPFWFGAGATFAQSGSKLVLQADSLYNAKNYALSAQTYDKAFKQIKPSATNYYNAACSAALAGDKKKAFQFLDAAIENNWENVKHLKSDPDLSSLYKEKAWPKMVAKLEEKVAKMEAGYDKSLQAELLLIFDQDQTIRHEYLKVAGAVGYNHHKVDSLGQIMTQLDKLNQEKIIAILDKYGWVGPDKVGSQASQAIFLVIQHADQQTQEKYLPLMRDAVKKGKAQSSSLALMEDRVLIRRGQKQLYGSQIGMDEKTGEHYVLPLEDPLKVDSRRAQMGLPPLADYVKNWKITWNAETYLKEQTQK